jgi:acyl carrier protein
VAAANEKVLACVYAAIDEANEDRLDLPPLPKSLDTQFQTGAAALDSLALINFLVAVEEGIGREFGVAIVLSDDRALSVEPNPLESVRALAQYIEALLREQRG